MMHNKTFKNYNELVLIGDTMKELFLILIILLLSLSTVNAQENVNEADPGVTPDSFLWGLDNAIDRLNLLLTFDEGKRARKGLEVARERLLEVRAMIEENKLDAAEKAKEEHGKTLVKVKESVQDLKEDNSLEEIEDVIEIEKDLEKYDDEVEETFDELKIKIKIEGELTQEQRQLIDSLLNSFKDGIGELEIEIKNKKDKTKIKIKQETGKSDEETEIEIEDLEKEKGIRKQEKAFEAIQDAEEELDDILKEKEISQDLLSQFNSLLEQARKEFELGNFIEAKQLAKKAEKLFDDIEEDIDEEEREIEIEEKELRSGKTKEKKIKKEKTTDDEENENGKESGDDSNKNSGSSRSSRY